MEFVIASHNQKKIREIAAILGTLGISFEPLPGGAPEPEETGPTFEENALIKARAACALTGKPAIADDSGLEIDYLDGEPGVHSARYMGENTPYQEKNNQILKRLEGVPMEQRTARFVCAIAAVFPDGKTCVKRGTIEGYIGDMPAGSNGFGYDPIFYLDQYHCSTAQLSREQKNALSHRGNALRAIREELERRI